MFIKLMKIILYASVSVLYITDASDFSGYASRDRLKEKRRNDEKTSIRENTIKLGVLLPYTAEKKAISSYFLAKYYASAMYVALNDINNDQRLLPNHNLSLVWSDTKCNTALAIKQQNEMINYENVDGFVAAGCYENCAAIAKNAAAVNIPIIGFMCQGKVKSRDERFSTFAKISDTRRQYVVGVQKIVEHYRWNKVAVLFESSSKYKSVFKGLKRNLRKAIVSSGKLKTQSIYTYDQDYLNLQNLVKKVTEKAKVIVVLATMRLAKEVLIAASDLNLVNGKHAFIIIEDDVLNKEERQESTFKWAVADYATDSKSANSYQHFIERSCRLTKAWKVAILLSPMTSKKNFKNTKKTEMFYDRVRKGTKKYFGSSVYEGLIPGTNYDKSKSKPPSYAEDLYDSIKMYAEAIHEAIENGDNFHDGKIVLQNMKKQSFSSLNGYERRFDENMELDYHLKVYHYAKNEEEANRGCGCLEGPCKSAFPKMEEIGKIDYVKQKRKYVEQMKYVQKSNAPMYWPGDVSLEDL